MATLLLDIVRKHIIEDDYSPSESFESLLQGGYEWESIYAEIAKAYYDFWEGGKAITTHFIRKIICQIHCPSIDQENSTTPLAILY